MRLITTYNVVSDASRNNLCLKINFYMKEGWQPYGSPYYTPDGNHNQAIVKFSEVFLKDEKKGRDIRIENITESTEDK